MNQPDIDQLCRSGHFPIPAPEINCKETHISWVILTPDAVYKIKKPVHYSFLDFSSLEKRHFFCEEELRLNRRLAPDMYLGVLPVGKNAAGTWQIGEPLAETLDYAVWMQRQNESRQMDLLLAQGLVTGTDIDRIADQLAVFHQTQHREPPPGDMAEASRVDFDDLFERYQTVKQFWGAETSRQFGNWKMVVDHFVHYHRSRIQARAKTGFWVDGHGDLHCRNIFLTTEQPVIFDCIEFNPHFRQLDVLNELAFLCMDLELAGRNDLAERLMARYCAYWDCMPEAEDRWLFVYFKAYRANVRLKILLLQLEEHLEDQILAHATQYMNLLKGYMKQLTDQSE